MVSPWPRVNGLALPVRVPMPVSVRWGSDRPSHPVALAYSYLFVGGSIDLTVSRVYNERER